MHFKIAVVAVRLTRQQRFEFAARHLGLERAQRRFRLGDGSRIFLALAELDQCDLVVALLLDPGQCGELLVERGALLH